MAPNGKGTSLSTSGVSNVIPRGDPYYTHGMDQNSVKLSLVLSESLQNYPTWYREMMVVLTQKNKLGFVDGTRTDPATDNRPYEAWQKCNHLVLSWIRKNASPNIGKKIQGMDKAADVWSFLKSRYSPGAVFIISGLRDEIHSLRQRKDEEVTSYFNRFGTLWEQLEILWPLPACTCRRKCTCDALRSVEKQRWQDKLGSFLRGLHDRFNPARLEIMQKESYKSLEQVHRYLLGEEKQMDRAKLTAQQSQSPSSASSAYKQPRNEAITGTKKQLVLPNHIHPHPLTLMEPGEPYKCDGCQELGFGRSYRCESSKCSYVLHEDCGHAVLDKSPVHHPFFKEDKFSFLEKPLGWPRHCEACRKIVRGFVYHRADNGRPDDTGLDLHPCCLKLKDGITYEEGNVTKTLKLRRTIPQKCLKCNSQKVEKDESKVKGWSYVSSDESYCFHVSCFKELIVGKVEQGYFSEKRMSMIKYDPKTQRPLTSKEMTKAAGSSKGSGAIKIATKIAVVVLKVIFAVIFGNPTSLILDLLELAFPAGIN